MKTNKHCPFHCMSHNKYPYVISCSKWESLCIRNWSAKACYNITILFVRELWSLSHAYSPMWYLLCDMQWNVQWDFFINKDYKKSCEQMSLFPLVLWAYVLWAFVLWAFVLWAFVMEPCQPQSWWRKSPAEHDDVDGPHKVNRSEVTRSKANWSQIIAEQLPPSTLGCQCKVATVMMQPSPHPHRTIIRQEKCAHKISPQWPNIHTGGDPNPYGRWMHSSRQSRQAGRLETTLGASCKPMRPVGHRFTVRWRTPGWTWLSQTWPGRPGRPRGECRSRKRPCPSQVESGERKTQRRRCEAEADNLFSFNFSAIYTPWTVAYLGFFLVARTPPPHGNNITWKFDVGLH